MNVLTSRRVIEGNYLLLDVSEEYAIEIQDAIHAGVQLSCHSRRGGDYETCVTRFADPRTGEKRFAVEVWWPSSKETLDFGTEREAMRCQVDQDNWLGLI